MHRVGSLLSVIKTNANTRENIQERPPVRRKDDECRSLMEEEVQRSLVITKSSAAFECLWFSLNPSSDSGFDSSLLSNHMCRVALVGILSNESSHLMANSSPRLLTHDLTSVLSIQPFPSLKMKFSLFLICW